jgi:hypothetical protein
MQTYCGALPVLPEKKEVLKQFTKDIATSNRKDFEKSEKRLGVKKESWFLQETPQGDWLIIYLEAENAAQAFADFAVSKDPFDMWARAQMKEFTGIDFSTPPQGPPPAQIVSLGY